MGFPILVRWHLYIESGPRTLEILWSSITWCGIQHSNGKCKSLFTWIAGIIWSQIPGACVYETRWSYDHLITIMGFPILKRWHLYQVHMPHSHQVTGACCVEVTTRQSRAEYSSRPTMGGEQWWVHWIQCVINKWSCINFSFKFNIQIAYEPIKMTHDPCYISSPNHTELHV